MRVDAALVVAVLAEHAQRGVDDALLGPLAPGTHPRIVRERGAAHDRVAVAVVTVAVDRELRLDVPPGCGQP